MEKILCPKKNINKVYYELLKQAESYFEMPTLKVHPNGSTTYMGMAIINLALSYVLTKDKRYLDDATRFMDTVTSYEVWGANHLVNVDLSASFILFGLSLAYNWLYDELDNDKRVAYYNKIKLQAKIMYDYKIETKGHGWSTNYWQNHNWINHTSMLMASFVIKEKEALIWQDDALKNFDYIYNHLPSDGSNYEGITYWRYGGIWLFISSYLIKEVLGINYFDKVDYFKNTFYFRLYQTDARSFKQLNFGDCHDRYSSHPVFLYYMVSYLYDDPYARWYADYIFDNYLYEEQYRSKVKPGILPEMWLCYLFYNEGKKINIDKLPKYRYFPDLGLIGIKSSFASDAKTFAIKCGFPGGKTQFMEGKQNLNYLGLAHHHPDNLSYILTYGNDYFVIDDGYNRDIKCRDHNSLLVDDTLLDIMDKGDTYKHNLLKRVENGDSIDDYGGTFNDLVVKDDIYLFTLDNTNLYPKYLVLSEVSRTVLTPNLDYLIFIDTFKSSKQHKYETNINSDYIAFNNNGYDCYKGKTNELYHYVLGNNIKRNTYERIVKSVMTTQEPDNYCQTKLNSVSYFEEASATDIVEILSFKELKIEETNNGYIIDGNELWIKNLDKTETDAKAIYKFKYNNKNYIALINGSYLNINNKDKIKEEKVGNYLIEI